ncbi:hypothetical protein [Vibrio quintilis]|uniref:Uncharacterized protein n=1 Tax=Vibrio quintilis TaxID=1117707 RepID=A0A1M7Z2N1_9VIBR|nr:hypothetical protein [Vibrio quintilis]SHO58906.1 hypothetical protein VQ7734_04681 [Vibrio quintilis]
MSNSIVLTSKYEVNDTVKFKASLAESLGSDTDLQKRIKVILDQVAKEAKASMPKDSKVSIRSVIKTQSGDGKDPIELEVKGEESTLTVSGTINQTLDVVVTDAFSLDSDVDTSVSYTKEYSLTDHQSASRIVNILSALKAFDEGKKFDNALISADLKSDAQESENTAG